MAEEEHLPGCSALFSTIDGGPFNDRMCDCWPEQITALRAQLAAFQAGNDNARSAIAIWEQTTQELRAQLAARDAEVARLREAARDALSGWIYIRGTHGDLYGVGWSRVQDKLEAALERKE